MTQTVLTAVGYAVGAYFGYPQLGAIVGSAIGGSIQASQQKFRGPKLDDLRFGSSQYGEPIPYAFGSPRIAGQVWWASDKRPIANTTGGKGGGPEITTYTYEIDLLIGLLDGPCQGLSRIFSNGKTVWTRRAGASDTSLAASDGNNLWRRLTLYTGTSTQLPDPTYEAAVGTGNAPAYRGRTYLMIEGLQLGQSGQIPNLTFELSTQSALSISGVTAGPIVPMAWGCPVGSGVGTGTKFRLPLGTWDGFFSANKVVQVYDIDPVANTAQVVGSYTAAVADYPATGNSDQPAMFMVGTPSTTAYLHLGVAGTRWTYTLAESNAGSTYRYALAGSDFILGNSQVGNKRLYRFGLANGGPAVTSAPLADYVASIVLIDGTVYAVSSAGANAVFVLDAATLTLQSTLAGPSGTSGAQSQLFNLAGELALFAWNGTQYGLYVYRGGTWVTVGGISSTNFGTLLRTLDVAGGLLIGGFGSATTLPYQFSSWYARITLDPTPETVQAVVGKLCARAGMPAGTYDTSALASITRNVRALAVGQLAPARAVLEQLSTAYFFEVVLRDKLYFRPRAAGSVATIPWADLAAAPEAPAPQPLELTLANDLELPPQVAVTYANVNDDQQSGTEYSDRIVSGQASIVQVELAIGMTPDEAKAVADGIMADTVASKLGTQLSLPLSYAKLEAGDVVDVIDEDARAYRLRFMRKREERGVLAFECLRDDASVVLSQQLTDTTQAVNNSVAAYGATTLQVLDIPLLRDADDGPGYYVAAKGATTPWPGCVVQVSGDQVTYTQAAEIGESAIFGTASSTLGNYTGIGFDEVNTLTVNVGAGQLASSTRAAMLDSDTINALLVGSELVRFRTATLVSPGVYTLSGFLRGQRGTEWAMPGHVANERVVLLTPSGMRRVATAASEISKQRYLRAITLGQLAAAASQAFTNTGVSSEPLAPVDVRAQRVQATAAIRITWKRRTRLQVRYVGAGGFSVPLDETAERYEVEIFSDAGYSTLKRTLAATAPTVDYSADLQTADFGNQPSTIYVRVYQISATVGRGYRAQQALAGLDAAQYVSRYWQVTSDVQVSNIDTRGSGAILAKEVTPAGFSTLNWVVAPESNGVSFVYATSLQDWKTSNSAIATSVGLQPGSLISAFGFVGVFLAGTGIFQRLEWTGNGAGARDIAHTLGVAPALALVKRAVSAEKWYGYSSVAGAGLALRFPDTIAPQYVSAPNAFPSASTSTALKVGADLNANGMQHTALVFAGSGPGVETGTYTGNGTSSGPLVALPWEADVLIIRATGGSGAYTFITCSALRENSAAKHWLLDDFGSSPAYTEIVQLTPASFQPVSTDLAVNENGVTYQYWARKR